ncbi:TniQ protein [Nitrospirillum amazonense]|uniref:TniQ protein n=1 Tax=Nitrospirillum amazonense TaxID=28077 RepID=A0A560EUA7_9PROT|nr:TniQ family protein [Nitrospirillum amazonense]TWB12969.1 TniQ protein [Nitrospirillum amazonense]
MNAWRAKVPLGDGEDLVSFCRRMAIVSGSPTLGGFLTDIGTTMPQVVQGTDEAVRIAAEFGRVDADRLRAVTLKRDLEGPVHARGYRFNGHPVAQRHVERSVMRLCPLCLAEDRERWPDLHGAAPFIRGEWQLKWMRACPVHAMALVADGEWPAIGPGFMQGNLTPLQPSGMEAYLRHRATAKPSSGGKWLEGLHLGSVADFCEAVGLLANMEHEIAANKIKARALSIYSLSLADRHAAGDVGWQILSGGPEAFRQFIKRFAIMACTRGGIMKPGGILGPLHVQLAKRPYDNAFDSIRNMVRETIADSTPIAPTAQIYGAPLGERSMSSIHVAAKAMGLHHKWLRKLLVLGGVITNGGLVFRMDGHTDALLQEIAETMSLKQAGIYINAPRVQMRLLLKSGILQASAAGGDGKSTERSFSKRDLDEFLAKLTKNHKTNEDDVARIYNKELFTIPDAAKKARCSAVDIIQLIFDGRIGTIEDRDDYGYMSVHVSPAEIRGILYGSRTGLSLQEAAEQTGWGRNLITFLVNESLLPFEVVENPVTRLKQRMVTLESLHDFKKKYVVVDDLMEIFKGNRNDVKKQISDLGINPVRHDRIGLRIYNRSDMPEWIIYRINRPSFCEKPPFRYR